MTIEVDVEHRLGAFRIAALFASAGPLTALFGPSGDVEWGPWQVPSRVVTTPFHCRPCGQDGCGGSKVSDCLTAIHPQAVLSALDDLLRETMR